MTAACVCSEQRAAAGSLGNLPLIPDNEANGPKRGSQTPASPSSQAHGSSARALANTSKLGIKKKEKKLSVRTHLDVMHVQHERGLIALIPSCIRPA